MLSCLEIIHGEEKAKASSAFLSVATTTKLNIFEYSVKNGIRIKSLTSKRFKDTGRGIMTTKEVSPGDVIISLPKDQLITLDSLYESMLKGMFSVKCDIQSKDIFIIYLLLERAKKMKSRLSYYLESVPKTYTTPSYLNNKCISFLPKFVQEMFRKQKIEITRHLSRIKRIQNVFEYTADVEKLNVTYENVRWAWNVINTRSVYFDPKHLNCLNYLSYYYKVDFALAPVLDLLNHKDTATMEASFNTKTNEYEITVHDSYQPKDQVFINYGPHCNRTLFYEYGFIIPDNIHQNVPIDRNRIFDIFGGESNIQEKFIKYIDNIKCTLDGLDWNYSIVTHVLTKPKNLKSDGFPKACPMQECCTYAASKILLNLIISETNENIKQLCLASKQCEVCENVSLLLKLELQLLKRAFENLKTTCVLKDT